MNYSVLLYVLLFIGILAIVQGLFLLVFGKSISRETKVNRRMQMLERGEDPHDVLLDLRREREGNGSDFSLKFFSSFSRLAARADLNVQTRTLLLVVVILSVVLFFLFERATGFGSALNLVVALIAAYGGVYFWLSSRAQARIEKFEEQLPDAVDLIVRSLRVGHPFVTAIGTVAKEMPDPIGTEFGLVADETTYGMDLTDALERVSERIDSQDFKFMTVAIGIQNQSGGNLAEILDNLSKVIRSRFRMFRKIRTITAEGRWSGWFLSVFPILALFGVKIIKPDYYERVADHALFQPGVYLTFFLLFVNIVFIRAIVQIKV